MAQAAQAAKAQAQAEGITLLPAGRVDNSTGYSGVALYTAQASSTPFQAKSPRGYLGSFASAEEAALAIAREKRKHQVPAPPLPPPKKRKVTPTAAARKSSRHG